MASPLATTGKTATVEDVERGLLAIVVANGSCTQAARDLKEQHGFKINEATLWRWKNERYQDRYLEIRREIEPKIRELLAAEHEDAALLAVDRVREGLKALDITQLPPKEIAGVIRNISTAAGIHSDKAAAARGRPTEITEHRHAIEIVTKLRTVSPGLIVDGTAEEIEESPTEAGLPSSV